MMYQDRKRNRLLLANGISLMEPENYAQVLYEKGEDLPHSVRIPECSESETFECLSGVKIGYDIDLLDHDHTFELASVPTWYDKDDVFAVVCGDIMVRGQKDSMLEFRRNRYLNTVKEHGSDVVLGRVETEIDYFYDSPRPDIIAFIVGLLSRFLEDGVVWGVGRGSSCSSLVFYLIGVHDVDPLKYNLPFSELTKEQSDAY